MNNKTEEWIDALWVIIVMCWIAYNAHCIDKLEQDYYDLATVVIHTVEAIEVL